MSVPMRHPPGSSFSLYGLSGTVWTGSQYEVGMKIILAKS